MGEEYTQMHTQVFVCTLSLCRVWYLWWRCISLVENVGLALEMHQPCGERNASMAFVYPSLLTQVRWAMDTVLASGAE